MHHMHRIVNYQLPEWALLVMVGIVLMGALYLHFKYPTSHDQYPWDTL